MNIDACFLTAWQQLRRGQITAPEALELVRDDQGTLNLSLLDEEVSQRFFQLFSETQDLPPVVPLLLWQNRYYLGSPTDLSAEAIQQICDRTLTDTQILPITEKSYRCWHHARHLDVTQIDAGPLINPLTGKQDQEDISETTELFLSKASGQIDRIKMIIASALRNRASDIHLEPTVEGLQVRYRIDGVLRNVTLLPLEVSRRVIVALKVMASMDIADSRRPHDGRIGQQYTAETEMDLEMDMRVSTLPCVGGEKAVIRLLPRKNPFSTIDKLGLSPKVLATYQGWLEQPQGVIIITGPTGSGKTSTLYTSLQAIAQEHVNVVTIEDPVEYVLPNITQTQVNEAAGMTFAAGLRSILRQDPDIIMVGEVRDHETAETAVRAALTGHLVFTTLHTNDAIGAIPRIQDMGPDPSLISDALLGVVAQRLVRCICPHCVESYPASTRDLNRLGLLPAPANAHIRLHRGRGCNQCLGSGYLGRESIVELLEIDDPIREIIHSGNITDLHRYLKTIDFMSFRQAAIEKVLNGTTSLEEIFRVLPRSAFRMAPSPIQVKSLPTEMAGRLALSTAAVS